MNANLQSIDVVVPVYNEEPSLAGNIELLVAYLRDEFPFRFGIVIADNASTDGTPEIARMLGAIHPEVSVLSLDRKGRGLALRTAWLRSNADVVSYMSRSSAVPDWPTISKPSSSSRRAIPSRSSTESSASATRTMLVGGAAMSPSDGKSAGRPGATTRTSRVRRGTPFSWCSPRSTVSSPASSTVSAEARISLPRAVALTRAAWCTAMVAGALQVPPSGLPILLGADHPTTGGYPVLGVVAADDLWLAGQLRPGDTVRFASA